MRPQDVLGEKTLEDYALLLDSAGRVEPAVAQMILRGEDRRSWLQGQVTNDVRRLEEGKSLSFCLCSSTGSIEAVIDAWSLGDAILMTCETVAFPAVQRRVERMVVMEDVSLEDAGSAYRRLSIQGARADEALRGIIDLPESDAGETRFGDAPVWCLRSDRLGYGGWDIWAPREASAAIATLEARFPLIGAEACEICRVEGLIPAMGRDISARTLPPELGSDFEKKHVSYKKGCYVGQEVLARIESRGQTKKTWVGLVAQGPLEVGARVTHAKRSEGGVVTSAAYSPARGYIGTAMVRREIARNGEPVVVEVNGGKVAAQVGEPSGFARAARRSAITAPHP